MAIAPKPWEQIFDDIVGGSRAEWRARQVKREDELNDWHPPALVHGNDPDPIVEAEVIEREPERTDSPPRVNAKQASHAARRTYTLSDFGR